MLKKIISTIPDWQRTYSGRSTLLHVAAATNKEIITILLENGIDIDCRDKYLETPLHEVVQNGEHPELAEFLLQSGADMFAETKRGITPIDDACRLEGEQALLHLQVFIGRGVLNYPEVAARIITSTIDNRLDELLAYILDEDKNIDCTPYLWHTVSWKQVNVYAFKLLVEHGADPECLSEKESESFLAYICKNLVTANKQQKESLLEIYDFLMEKGVPVSIESSLHRNCLHYLQAKRGFAKQTQTLIELGCDVNVQAEHVDGMQTYYERCSEITPLMLAAWHGLLENVKILLAAGADTRLTNKESETAYDLAIMRKKTKTAKYILNSIQGE